MKARFEIIKECLALGAWCAVNPRSAKRILAKRWKTRIMNGVFLGFVPYHEAATAAVKEILGPEWSFGFETFESSTLGRCYYDSKRITISWEYAMDELGGDGDNLVKTTLHEIAHGLAWERFHDGSHGWQWGLFCRLLGIPGAKPGSTIRLFAGSRARGYLYYPDWGELKVIWSTPEFKKGGVYIEGVRMMGARFLTWREVAKYWPDVCRDGGEG